MSTSLSRQGGYLLIDHSASPGIPPDLAAQWEAQGIPVAVGSVKLEADTWTCAHCQAVVIKNMMRTRPREVCRNCMHVVCDKCVTFCEPFKKIADEIAHGKFVMNDDRRLLIPR